jgi:hypothetical protein
MQLKDGGYYRRRDGLIAGPAENRGELWSICGNHYEQSHGGLHRYKWRDFDLIAEVTVSPVLPCELRAGGKYTTQKTDGSAGPVVTLERSTCMRSGFLNYLPFQSAKSNTQSFFAADGSGFDADKGHLLRITGEYVEPPPTPIERLELWHKRYSEFCDKCKAIGFNEDVGDGLGTIIADLKAEASNG